MAGFRRAQLRGSDELFRPTKNVSLNTETTITVEETIESPVVEANTVHHTQPVPVNRMHAPHFSTKELTLLAEAVQRIKFPGKTYPRPSVEDFEMLEDLRQKLLDMTKE